MTKIPEYLFHYTSLSSLALILKNRSIRFNSLPYLDDQEERLFSDMSEMGKYCFVSSWTDCSDEKISLWSMYTKDMTGVRIKLHQYPFETYKIHISKNNIEVNDDNSIFPKEWYDLDNYTFIPYELQHEDKMMYKVIYTDKEEEINPQISSYNAINNLTSLNLNKIGKYKRKEWEFQDEVRYRILFIPMTFREAIKNNNPGYWYSRMIDLPFTDKFLKIRQDYFDNLEIITGPKMPEGDKILLKLLVEKYCPSAKIDESKFTNKIK